MHDAPPEGDIDGGRALAQTGVWEQRFPNTSPAGVCCVDGGNVFDVANRRFVRFPGASLGHGYQWSRGVKLKNSAAVAISSAVRAARGTSIIVP